MLTDIPVSFSPVRFNSSQYFKCFILATTKLWNILVNIFVEAAVLQKLKLCVGYNAFLLGVDGP